MAIELNHTIIQAKDAHLSAKFLAEMLGLASSTSFGPFIVVKTSNAVSLDFRTTSGEVKPRHFAFLVSEQEFDEIFNRIAQKQLKYWADPGQTQSQQIRKKPFNQRSGRILAQKKIPLSTLWRLKWFKNTHKAKTRPIIIS